MPSKIRFTYIIPNDEDADSPQVDLFLDDDCDVLISQEENNLFISLPQAFALHRALGQALVRNERSFGNKLPALKLA